MLITTVKNIDNFGLYITTLRLEDSRRKGDIKIDDAFLPTVQNIFDKTRMINIEFFGINLWRYLRVLVCI